MGNEIASLSGEEYQFSDSAVNVRNICNTDKTLISSQMSQNEQITDF